MRQTYDGLVIEGRAARADAAAAVELVERLRRELDALDLAAAELGALEVRAASAEEDEEELRRLSTLADAAVALDGCR